MADLRESSFWVKVDRKSATECWPWMAGKYPNGYGSFYMNGRSYSASRVAWMFTFGAIPDGMFVCHRCDNPACVNPNHLFLGTAKDNMVDKAIKGRGTRGESVNTNLLTQAQVKEIRQLSGTASPNKVAERYGVSRAAIYAIWSGRNWKWLK